MHIGEQQDRDVGSDGRFSGTMAKIKKDGRYGAIDDDGGYEMFVLPLAVLGCQLPEIGSRVTVREWQLDCFGSRHAAAAPEQYIPT